MDKGAALLALALAAPAGAATVPTAAEVHPGLLVEPIVLAAPDGARLQAVVTKPDGARERLPAILYVQWLSCDTVAIPARPSSGWDAMLQRLVRETGALVWRTEKRGVGGSDGRCADLDYATELSDHRAALAALRARRDVDPSRIVIFGASMGSNLAPLLAAGEDVAGVAVWGGGARTWAERTLAFERNRIDLASSDPAGRAAEMAARLRIIARVVVEKQAPRQVIAAHPELAGAASRMGLGDDGMFGRPLAFHWQAQEQDWAGAWGRVRAPVLALVGEFDWFEEADGALLIADIVNARRPGMARARVVPGLDHHFSRYPDRRSAFREEGGVVDAGAAMDELLPWLAARFGMPSKSR